MMPGRFKLSVLILLILLSPAGASMAEAQLAPAEAGAETPAEEEWTAPDLLNLPSDWLTQLEAIEFDEETIQLRFDRFAESANQRIQGLDGQNLVEAEAALVGLGNKVTSLLAAIQGKAGRMSSTRSSSAIEWCGRSTTRWSRNTNARTREHLRES
jgi:hypothetical protein